MEKERLINYAKLIAKHGLNVQKGQDVVLTCSMDQLEFIKILVEQLYLCGARKVITNFKDPEIKKLDIQYQALEDLMTKQGLKVKTNHESDAIAIAITAISSKIESLLK